jgi:hypothetical protein
MLNADPDATDEVASQSRNVFEIIVTALWANSMRNQSLGGGKKLWREQQGQAMRDDSQRRSGSASSS